jgi:hypothetical protein
LAAVLVLAMHAGGARAAGYVDAGLPDLTAEQKVVVKNPQPVQLLFQFQTKGAPNARATKFVEQQVLDTVKNSGLFSDVSDAPTANGAILSVTINNAPDPGDMAAAEVKGAVTGATLFIAGSTVRDNYICTVDYVASPTAPKISASAKHGVYFQMGLINSPPPNAVKVEGGIKGAVFTMVRQIVSHPLNTIAADPGFQTASAAPTSVAPDQPATPATASPAPTQSAPTAPASAPTAPTANDTHP